jgi:hypothetical protein
MMASQLGVSDILDAVESKVMALGLFDSINMHEPKSSPGQQGHAAIWVQRLGPAPGASGLAATAGRLELRIRLYGSMLSEPQDEIDPDMTYKVDTLLAEFSGDFDLGARVRNVDLLGAYGEPLGAQAGYLNLQNSMFRIMDITLPLIVNDIWNQEA